MIVEDQPQLLVAADQFDQSLPISIEELSLLLRHCSVQFVLGLMLMTLAASCGGNSDDDVPLLFAAASLSDVLSESAAIDVRET